MGQRYEVGPIFVRENEEERGADVPLHEHPNFAHATFILSGWWLLRGVLESGKHVVAQFASKEYEIVRELHAQYRPDKMLRPVRMPDKTFGHLPQFSIVFIAPGEAVPDGGEELEFAPGSYFALIPQGTPHELFCLSDAGTAACVYTHRDPSDGSVVQARNGWEKAYE